MKFFIKAFLIVITLTIVLTDAPNLKENCDNPCTACQRAAYQLKFQQKADCGGSRCKNTCQKVRDMWFTAPDKVFQAFEKDMFGKCEICFRAGFCSITECKGQEDLELQYINEVVNRSHFTSKKTEVLPPQALANFHKDLQFYDPSALHEMDRDLDEAKAKISKTIEESVSGNAEKAIKEVKALMDKLFNGDATFSGEAVKEGEKKEDKKDKNESLQDYVKASKQLVENVKKLVDLAAEAKEKDQKDKSNELVESTLKELKSKIAENKKIAKLAEQDKEIKKAVDNVTEELKELKRKLKRV